MESMDEDSISNLKNNKADDSMEDNENDLMDTEDGNNDEGNDEPLKTYLPNQPLEEGEELVVDRSAYRMLHVAQSGAPCLSFDIIPDDLGQSRESYPLSMYIVAGTQAAKTHLNQLLVMKLSNLTGIDNDSDDSDSDSESSDSEDENDKRLPKMSLASVKHNGCVNRVRCTKFDDTVLAASWSELGRVHIWNLAEQLKTVETDSALTNYKKKYIQSDEEGKPLFTFKGHTSEGYGIDWCPIERGVLATGDSAGAIHIWRLDSSTSSLLWHVDQRPYNSHMPHSVEDLQWSPSEKNVLASCSVDKSIKIWDVRAKPQSACMLTATGAHTEDINVISWNKKENQFLVSGGDDGIICVWDLRQFNANGASPVAKIKQHTAPVTTVEWHPQEASVFASGGSDDQIAQWDLSVEADDSDQDPELANLPPQLLFIHQGQSDIKELHWHPQCPGVIVSTAHSGFNVFRTISV